MDNDDSPLHEFRHRSGIRVRVPKGYYVGKRSPDMPLQLVRGDEHFEVPLLFVEDLSAYLEALAWYEGDAMTPASPDWQSFVSLLKGNEGINLKPEWENKRMRAEGPRRFTCACSDRPEDWVWDRESNRWPKAFAIMEKHFPGYDVHDTAAYWMLHKADCDHAVAFDVDGLLSAGFARMVSAMVSGTPSGMVPKEQ